MSLNIYPCTIVADRYGGVYSRGAWIAWPLGAEEIPSGPDEGDVEAPVFWSQPRRCGRGKTPDAALADLERVMREEPEDP